MVKIPFGDDVIARAHEEERRFLRERIDKPYLKNSVAEQEGIFAGLIGELIVADYIGAEIKHTFDYDLVWRDWAIDVKTKRCTTPPQPFYLCTVAAANTTQKCDAYTFVRVDERKRIAWILGSIKKSDFFKQATKYFEGDLDPSSQLGWRFKADCYNLPASKLKPFKTHVCNSETLAGAGHASVNLARCRREK